MKYRWSPKKSNPNNFERGPIVGRLSGLKPNNDKWQKLQGFEKKCKITFWVEISKLVGEDIPHLLPELLTLSSKPPIFHLQFRHLEILGCTWRCAWLTSLCGWGGTNLSVIFSQNDDDLAVKLADPLHFPQTTLCGCDSVSFSLLLKLELLNVTSGEMIQSKSLFCSRNYCVSTRKDFK